MKQYYLNKKEILTLANKAFKYLNLPKTRIIIRKKNQPCSGMSSSYCLISQSIYTDQVSCRLKFKIAHKTLKHLEDKKLCAFLLLHEVSHYYQHYYHPKWLKRYTTNREYYKFKGKHREKKIERVADKIAWILYNKVYKGRIYG